MLPVVIVTGSSRGLGLATVRALLESQKVNVVGVSRTMPESSDQVRLEEVGGSRWRMVRGDITDPAVQDDVVREALNVSGEHGVVGLVNNAGVIDPVGLLADVEVDAFKRLMDVNLVSVLGLTQKVLPYLLKQSHFDYATIVNVSSGAAVNAYQAWGSYCCSKAALNMLTGVLALEHPDRLLMIALRPGVVDTDMQKRIAETGRDLMSPEVFQKFADMRQQGQMLATDVPAAVMAKLVLEHHSEDERKQLHGQFVNWNDPRLK